MLRLRRQSLQPRSRKSQRPVRQPCLPIPKVAWIRPGARTSLTTSWGLARSWWGQQRSPCGGGRDRSVLIGRSAHLRGAQSPASRQSRPWPGPTRPPHQGQRLSSRPARRRGPWCQCRRRCQRALAAAGGGWALQPPAGRQGPEDFAAREIPRPGPARLGQTDPHGESHVPAQRLGAKQHTGEVQTLSTGCKTSKAGRGTWAEKTQRPCTMGTRRSPDPNLPCALECTRLPCRRYQTHQLM
mmetsp:Transcript_11654/g.36016  ORF Transcript_11654/g.36016 Transcript_11654/m.36016 type:complete len:241 (+) Transcript_11654:492-1214(+)